MKVFDMIREAPLRYAVTFYVEADNYEALKAAVEYVAKRMEIGRVVYACGRYACFCRVKVEWDGSRLTVRSCMKRAVRAAVKLLVEAYSWFGGKSIQVVKI
jgi:hypothetical protein